MLRRVDKFSPHAALNAENILRGPVVDVLYATRGNVLPFYHRFVGRCHFRGIRYRIETVDLFDGGESAHGPGLRTGIGLVPVEIDHLTVRHDDVQPAVSSLDTTALPAVRNRHGGGTQAIFQNLVPAHHHATVFGKE